MKSNQKTKYLSVFSIFLLGIVFLFGDTSKVLACSGIPLKGNYALSANCTLGGSLIGVSGDLNLYTGTTGYQLTILNGQTARYTGKISIGNGYISLASGGKIENQDTYVVDQDGDGWPASGFNTQTGSEIYADAAAGRVARLSTISNIADYNDANASVTAYAYAQSWYYTYAQSWYYTYAQSWYYTYGQSSYYYTYAQSWYYTYGQSSYYYGYGQSWYYTYSQSGYYSQSNYWRYTYSQSTYYKYAQSSYRWRKAI